jgi:hypothetical protein
MNPLVISAHRGCYDVVWTKRSSLIGSLTLSSHFSGCSRSGPEADQSLPQLGRIVSVGAPVHTHFWLPAAEEDEDQSGFTPSSVEDASPGL